MSAGRFLRDNVFLVAAVLLPVAVVGVFLLATAIPRFMVPPPAYDLLLTAASYDQAAPRLAVEFTVRDDRVHATLRALPANSYPSRPMLWLFDHTTQSVRQVPVNLPDHLADGEQSRTIPIAELSDRRVVSQIKAPDGYEPRTRSGSSPGLVGDIFGMRRYDSSVSVVNRGRVVRVALPQPYEYQSPVVLGWVIDDRAR